MSINIIDKIVEIVRECIRSSHGVEDPSERARLLRKLASYLDKIGLREEARELLVDALRVALNIQESHERILEIVYVANALRRMGYIDLAFDVLDEGIKSLQSEEDPEVVLIGLLHIIGELIDMRAIDKAQEVVSMILNTIDKLESQEISDIEILLDALEYIMVLCDEKTKRDLFFRVLERAEEEEDEDVRNRVYEELIYLALNQNWLDLAEDIIVNRVTNIYTKVELLGKLIEYYEEKLSRIGLIYEETEED
ncbi:MAG: hypothetical protein ACTSUJ_08470 [Candidatus Njordarchaeales archaeon]